MFPPLWIGKTGLEAQQTNLSVLTNNMANVNTTGFKRGRAVFQDLIYQTVRQPGAQSSDSTELPTGLTMGTGVRIVATEKQFTQGNIIQTEQQLDVAVSGRGFFQIVQPDGTIGYTRDGSFRVDSDGRVVTDDGNPLEPGINFPADVQSITIGSDGVVSVLEPGNSTPTELGNIQLAAFINPAGLQPMGNNLYKETASSGTPQLGTPGLDGLGALVQGSLESSNVNVVEELVNMIETQRAYEMNSKAISTADSMLQFVNQTL